MNYSCNFIMADVAIEVKSDFPLSLTESISPFWRQSERTADIVYEICEGIVDMPTESPCYETGVYRIFKFQGTYTWQFFNKGKSFYLKMLNHDRSYFRMELTKEMYDTVQTVLFTNYMAFESPLIRYHAYWLHASLIKWKNRGLVFTAPSGGGKSTQAELWNRYMGAEIINGDRALLRRKENEIYAYGSLYAGSSGIYRNEKVRVSMIVILEKGKENCLEAVKPAEAFASLYSQILANPWDSWYIQRIIEEISFLIEQVPIYRFSCRPDQDAVLVVKEELERLSCQ